MPVADLSPDDDWLQQFLAGHQAGQAFGASQPYGAGGAPGPYSGGPQGLMPGGGLSGRTQTTPGAPSMGYPALSGPAQGPQLTPGAPQPSATGWSLTSNPITRGLNYLNPISSAQADVLHPNLSHPSLNPLSAGGAAAPSPSPSPLLRAGAADSLPLAFGNPTMKDYQEWLSRQLATSSPAAPPPAPAQAAAGPGYLHSTGATGGVYADMLDAYNYPDKIGNHPSWPTPPASSPASTTTAPPRATTPRGSPAQTPTPASSNRFIRIDRVNAGPLAQPGRGYQTALNLANLFGRG